MSEAQIIAAIVALGDWKGSSRQSLIKFFQTEHSMERDEATSAVTEGVKAGLASGSLIQNKQSFFAKGHTFAKPADITLGIEELLPPKKDASERAAKAGDVVDVAYVGKLAESGDVFETSSLVFVLGDGNVIKAWDEGVVGMREGQQRRLTCPPKLAYGKRGSPPEIGPDATLIFDITFRGFRTVKDIETFEEEEEEEEVDEEEEDDDEEEDDAAPKKRRTAAAAEEDDEDDEGDE